MMNKKGITLVEFIISVALVAIVMVFLFNLLVDVQYNSKNGTYAVDNQLNRASIIKTISDDFNNLGLVGLVDFSNYNYLRLTFNYKNGVSKNLSVGTNYVIYGDEKWTMRSSNSRTTYQKHCVHYQFVNKVCCTGADCESNICSDYFYVHIRIPVVIGRTEENTIDDLDLFYVGLASDINDSSFPTKSYLGYESNRCPY